MRTSSGRSTLAGLFVLGLLVAAGGAAAQEEVVKTTIPGALFSLLISIIQLIVGLSIAAFAITQGLKLLSKLLTRGEQPFDIWEQARNKNVAVALLGAGVIFSYCNVTASGIHAMTTVLGGLASGASGWKDGLSSLIGAALNLAVAIIVADFAITVVFRVMDRLTKNTDELAEFRANNVALGAIYCGILIGVSLLVSAGVAGIGLGVSNLLSALLGLVT
jgi:uncharacterized membrane protein YjfL (UPF0719 family)